MGLNRKKLSYIVILFAFLTAGCPSKQANRQLEIGADLTLSGPIAYWGQQIKKGLDLAVQEANSQPKQEPITILYQDNQGKVKNAISIFQRFASEDKVAAVTSIFTPISKPLRPLAAEYKIPLLATVVSAIGFGKINSWSFRDFPSQTQQGIAIAQFAYNHLKLRRAASLVVNDDYGLDGQNVFAKEFSHLGGKIVGTETVAQDDTDVRAQATKLISKHPDSLFIVVREATLGNAVRQFRELGFKGQIIGVNAFDAPIVWKTAGQGGDGVVFTSAYIEYKGNSEANSFSKAYVNKYGEEPDWVSVYGFTIGQYLCQTVRASGGNPEKMREQLSQLATDSIRGRIQMNADRDVISPIGIFQRTSGKNELLEKWTGS